MARGEGPSLGARVEAWVGRRIVRALPVPPGVRAVCVGGATLGGSGKTPLAVACAARLSESGARVALVGHAYGARPSRPRVVERTDRLAEVGDEALVAARALEGKALVVVAPTRRGAIAHAAARADVLVLDGVHQLEPRAALALLALDGEAPWGSGAPLPRGDLAAPRATLDAACDAVVHLVDEAASPGTCAGDARAPALRQLELVGPDGAAAAWTELAGASFGLFTALARPERIACALARRGLVAQLHVDAGDHGREGTRRAPPSAALEPQRWVATEKCALHAPPWMAPRLSVIRHRLALPPELRARLDVVASAARSRH